MEELKKQNQKINKITETNKITEKSMPKHVSEFPTHLLVDFLHR